MKMNSCKENPEEEFEKTILSIRMLKDNSAFAFGNRTAILYVTQDKLFWDQTVDGMNMETDVEMRNPREAYATVSNYISDLKTSKFKEDVKEAKRLEEDLEDFITEGPLENIMNPKDEKTILYEFFCCKKAFEGAVNGMVDDGIEAYHSIGDYLASIIEGQVIWSNKNTGNHTIINTENKGIGLYRKVEKHLESTVKESISKGQEILDQMDKVLLGYRVKKALRE